MVISVDSYDVPAAKAISLNGAFPLAIVLLLCLETGLRMYFFQPQIARTPDEYTCTRQADFILNRGSAAFPEMAGEVLDNPRIYAIQPSPTRVGYLWLLACFMRISGEYGPLAGASLSGCKLP